MPTLALVVISDRRDLYLPRCLESLDRFLPNVFDQKILVDDPEHKHTASGAVRVGWEQTDADFVWHMEEDFVLTQPVDLDGMAEVLDNNEHLAQLCLKRQPWSQPEHLAGGIVEMDPGGYADRLSAGHPWLEHRKWFSLNPCLVPRRVVEMGFPEGSEPAMTERLLDKGLHFGYWGARHDGPRCFHIGEIRSAGSVR